MKVSRMAETLLGSEIIKLAADIRKKMAEGKEIYNFTIGDFNPKVFPMPTELIDEIVAAYRNGLTNYPPSEGVPELCKAIVEFIKDRQGLDYPQSAIQVGGGARPMIYSVFETILDAGDTVVFPTPSWNNHNYVHLMCCKQVTVETRPEDNFMPTAEMLAPHLQGAALLSLCSPLNPTGTVFSAEELAKICDLVLAENKRRRADEKPLYLMYDQIYEVLTFGDTLHYDPVSLRPEMRAYTVFVDGASKFLASTGMRVGWAFGPQHIMDNIKDILSHIGAWAPKPEQMATAAFLANKPALDSFLTHFKSEIEFRLNGLHEGIQALKKEGFAVDAIAPQAAIYLTVQFALHGKTTAEGKLLETTPDVTAYILDKAGMALVPFSIFGASEDSSWYRLSVGTCGKEDVAKALAKLKTALSELR
jgi:aspartate aminotransferase